MKTIFIPVIALLICSGFACGSSAKNPDEVKSDSTVKSSAVNPLLIGKWQVDSSGFINDNVQKPLDAPLVDAFWEFTSDGKLNISGNVSYSTEIQIVDNSFKINLMGVESVYRIKSLSEKDLILVSTIVDTKDMKMESITKFKKLSK